MDASVRTQAMEVAVGMEAAIAEVVATRAPGAHNVNDLGVRLVPIDRAVELMP